MTERPRLAIIVAYAHNRVIGCNNTLPWHLPGDLRRFKRLTLHKPVIMGRKTYDSIGRPLPDHRNIVVTRDENWSAEGVEVTHTLEAAIALAETVARRLNHSEYFVIGGAELYRQAIPLAVKLYEACVRADFDGDAYFPPVDYTQWQQTSLTTYGPNAEDKHPLSFLIYDRIST